MASLFSCTFLSSKSPKPDYSDSEQHSRNADSQGQFSNPVTMEANDLSKISRIMWRYMFETRQDATPVLDIPVHALSAEQLISDNQNGTSVYRLGHSSLLLASYGEFWLIDPVFSERASPVQWMGPKRFHQPPLDIANLPAIKGVIISHDHYDHLDQASITALVDKAEHFVTPLGVGDLMREWGVADEKITQLDWWQHISVGDITLTATPAQHFSGRGITGGNQTLWASWAIQTRDSKLFYSGDTGYFDGFKEIGEKLGPFDLTMMENGAYDKDWADVHMTPEESLQAHLDVKGRAMLPVHNSTFDLALHPWYEPFERLSNLAVAESVHLVTPEIGSRVELKQLPHNSFWWRPVANQLAATFR